MLHRPFCTPVVIGFWLVTTAWLLGTKVLPSLNPGAPPGHQAYYTSSGQLVPVAWHIECNGRPVGWALTEANRSHRHGLFVDTRLHFDRIPWDEVLPNWASLIVERMPLDRSEAALDARGRLSIDEQGELQSFSSIATLPGTRETLVLTGTVHEGRVSMFVAAGDLRYETTRYLPTTSMVGDEFSPMATIPGLFVGRRWTVPIYSLLRGGHSPFEILHAEVVGDEVMPWTGSLVPVHVVSYREDPSSSRPPRCRLWVDHSGRVLRQEAALLGASVSFVRASDEEAARLAALENATVAAEGRSDTSEHPAP